MKSKRIIAAIVFLAGSTACSDPDQTLPEQAAEQAKEGAQVSQPAPSSSLAIGASLDQPARLLRTPALSQNAVDPAPLYAMNDRVPPHDVLVWKHHWEFDQSDEEGDDSTLFGASLNAIGDVNGDGYDDFAVGGWENDVDVYVFHGRQGSMGTSADLQIPAPQLGSHFGFTISSAGDVNNDGYDDMLIGAPSFSPSREDGGTGGEDAGAGDAGEGDPPTEGAAYLFMGSSAGISPTPAATWIGRDPASQLGRSVASAGDVNRDGYDDVAIGVPFAPADDGAPSTGRVDIYLGGGSGIDNSTAAVTLAAPEVNTGFGFSVAGVGDTDGDDFDDLLVGAIGVSDGETFEGGAYVFSGGVDGLSAQPTWSVAGANVQEAYFGWRVDAAGDIDNDGFNDVVIGAPLYSSDPSDETQVGEGAVFVYMGSASGLESNSAWQVESDRAQAALGTDISGGHDVNGDGFDDLLIADAHFGHVSYGGELYLGGENGLQADFDWQAIYEGNSTIGDTARFVGDVNGDGYGDMLLGGPYFAAIYLYYGAPCFDADWDEYKGYNAITCPQGDDCHDLHDSAYPGGDEICDDLDNNCDGTFDDGCDDDQDGFCDADINAWAPSGPPAVCPNGLNDCNDDDAEHNPASPELCNFIDDDCNDVVDEEPKVCGEQICVQGSCFDECTSDANCAEGQACYGGRCAADPCEGIVCPERREECFMGTCQVACTLRAECAWDDKQCIDGRCAVDACDGILCPTEEVCHEGACVSEDEIPAEDVGVPDVGSDAGSDVGTDADTGQTSSSTNSDDDGCSTTPGSVPPSGVMVLLVTLGGLLWRRRR